MTQKITNTKYNIDEEIQMLDISKYKNVPIYKLSQ